jgi:murein DD-endopeptidase MepM/ murein hydrolase activator NlpD
MKNNWKLLGSILLSLLLAATMTIMTNNNQNIFNSINTNAGKAKSIIDQEIVKVEKTPHKVYQLFNKGELVGILTDIDVLNDVFNQIYEERYSKDYPDSKVGLGVDSYLVEQLTYNYYADVDKQIVSYLRDNNLFAIEAYRIEFSNGEVCYVKNVEDFNLAREKYLLNFISPDSYELLKNKKLPPELTSFGKRDVSIQVMEQAQINKSLAPINKVLKNVEEIIQYLGYGYNSAIEEYVVKKYDTVEGIAYLNGLEVQNLISINPNVIKSSQQILEIGTKLNIAYFESPINVVTVQESLEQETVFPAAPKIIHDKQLSWGTQIVISKEKPGLKNVKYRTTYVNGRTAKTEELSSTIVQEPVDEVIRIGTAGFDGVILLPGTFRWPINSGFISCRWGCYYKHEGVDFQTKPDRYGPIIASASGYVVLSKCIIGSYGCYIKLSHENGFATLYGHLQKKSTIPVGTFVEKGTELGLIGMTGRTTGPHVHFEIQINGKRVDPCLYFKC